ncbi:MAG: hypothetical protein H6673_05770 [Anaerolineales bacterium]|nr:hypothetical protein [Anaerolineales bacterium]
MSSYQNFYIDKTNPFADTLTTFGLCGLIHRLFNSAQHIINIQDKGGYLQVACNPPVTQQDIQNAAGNIALLKAIKTPKNANQLEELSATVDYEDQKLQVALYFEARKHADKNHPVALPDPPHPHWDIFRAINPAALPGYNSLVLSWHQTRDAQVEIVQLLFDFFSTTPNNLPLALHRWKELDQQYEWGIKAETTGQQLYNPDQGKGQNRTKANGISIGNQSNFWLLEYLKAVGFYEAALTRQVRGAKDRKTFVVSPREMTFYDHRAVLANFVDAMQVSETSTKFDILAAIRYTVALIKYLITNTSERGLFGKQSIKKRLVGGFHTAFYKDLGNAIATMNLSFIALPGWVTLQNADDVRVYTELLEELELLTRQFDETHSDAFNLLQHLRQFVSGDDLAAFFDFTTAYPAYLMGMRERGKYAYQLTAQFVERLIMSTNQRLYAILEREGFHNIASAIRQSTVTAQYYEKKGDHRYDVRYGLGQQLARKARYANDFIVALSEFLHQYNAENAQVKKTRSGPYRLDVQTSDIDDIVELIDEFGAETVAKLLIAYGYARTPREQQDNLPEETLEETLE